MKIMSFRKRLWIRVATAFLFFGLAAGAIDAFASTETGVLSLSVQDAVRIALEQNPSIASDREKISEINQTVTTSYAQLFPVISGLGTGTKQKNSVSSGAAAFGGEAYNTYQAELLLKQPLYAGGALTGAISAAKNERDVRAKTLEADSRDLSVQVLEAFYTTLTNQQVYSILRDTQAVEERTVKTTTDYYRIGRSQLLDVLQAKTTLALLMPQIVNAENQMKTAASQLMQLLHESQARAVSLSGEVPYIEPKRVRAFLDQKKTLPEITRGEKQIAEFSDQTDVQLAPSYPSLYFNGMWGKQSYTQSELFNDYSNQWSVSLQLTVPISGLLTSIAQRQVLHSQQIELEYGQSALLDQLSFNERQAARNLDAAETVLKSSKAADEFSKASLKEAERDFKLQTINYLQFLTSQQSFLSAESSYVQAKYSYIDAVAKYFVATGVPVSSLVEILNGQVSL